MLDYYLNQTVTWTTGTINEYGELSNTVSKDIKVRAKGRRTLVRNTQGEQVISETQIICTESINPGDIINYGGRDWPVITVGDMVDLEGQTIGKKVYL